MDLPHTLRRDLHAQAEQTQTTDDMTLGLDASTTWLALARHLCSRPVTVVTPDLDACEALLGGAATVQTPGGTLHPDSRSVQALTPLPQLDLAFVSCEAFTAGGQLQETYPAEAQVKQQL
ncbi:hypothetical protein [Deinococcus hohokamensis]|uniref:DeoR-like transcriptional repressor C-terminal sensor domain-containing protein n=1 Tax=Deinococcus hohokamensis TaxID=309883 RepID=A0ABV9IG32_9DEIO